MLFVGCFEGSWGEDMFCYIYVCIYVFFEKVIEIFLEYSKFFFGISWMVFVIFFCKIFWVVFWDGDRFYVEVFK